MFKKLMFTTGLFVFIDQITKILISFFMNVNQSISIINNFFNLTYVQNKGAAFSILTGSRWLLIIIAIVVLNLIYHYLIKDKDLKKYEIILYALLLSGIIGNLIDRILYGYVIDFFDFKIFGYNFAIFNLADSFIVISVIVLLVISIRGEIKCKNILSK
ncbi:MAG: signal peptidase II [Bacilli bacterium]